MNHKIREDTDPTHSTFLPVPDSTKVEKHILG